MIRAGIRNMLLITGAVMGAGYASGREIWQFFGSGSGLAIIVFTILFILCTTSILQIVYKYETTNYVPILQELTGKKIATIYDGFILVYLFSVTVVMIAGSGATFQSFGIPFWWGILFIVVGLLIIFSNGINGLLHINQILMPLLILALFIMLWVYIFKQGISLSIDWGNQENILAGFPFTALNILPLIAVLGAIGNRIQSKVEIYITSILSGVILGTITFMYHKSLNHLHQDRILPDIPLFEIIRDYQPILAIGMMIMLWIAIYTTAAATLLGIITRINKKYNFPLIKLAAMMIVIMLPFTAIGFSRLISFIYPLYGLLNLYILVTLITYPFWEKRIMKKRIFKK